MMAQANIESSAGSHDKAIFSRLNPRLTCVEPPAPDQNLREGRNVVCPVKSESRAKQIGVHLG